MQLVRLHRPGERSLLNKLRQCIMAYKLERSLSKEQILGLYLNGIPYGQRTFGIEAAARRYFNKPASQLSLAESALLSALPRRPGRYSRQINKGRLIRRQRTILHLMQEQGRITTTQLRRALAEPLTWEAVPRPFHAPHLVAQLQRTPLFKRAARLKTTLDLPLQRRVEAAVSSRIARLRDAGVTNAAVLVIHNPTGEVLAHVGSADFFVEHTSGQVDGTSALRQPGSTMKPFTYALALERGMTPATLLQDLPSHFRSDQGDYAPRNYDDTFHGPVRLRVALGSSYNVPAIRAVEFVGVAPLLERLRTLGFRSLTRSARHYGLGLTLGNGEVTLQELTNGYATLARRGLHIPLRWVLEAQAADGEQLPLPGAAQRQVFDPKIAYLIGHILADPIARIPAFGRDTILDVGFPAAAKTGTSKDFRDNWTVGYTAEFTVGVWVGNFDGSEMHNVSGITGAAPLWAEVMILASKSHHALPGPPAGLERREICPLSGKLISPHCPLSAEEVFLAGTAPSDPCTFHQEILIDRRNKLRAGPGCPARQMTAKIFTLYPPAYRQWAMTQGIEAPPVEASPLCPRPALPAKVRIRFPTSGDQFYLDADLRRPYQKLPLEATVEGDVKAVRWFVNGRLVATARYPYSASWTIEEGQHSIVARLPDGRQSPAVGIRVR